MTRSARRATIVPSTAAEDEENPRDSAANVRTASPEIEPPDVSVDEGSC